MFLSTSADVVNNQTIIFGLEWKDFIPITISFLALILTVIQYFGEYKRKKRKDTLEAYDELQKDVFKPLNELRKKFSEVPIDRNFQKRSEITNYLAKIERFCVGVNLKIYDFKTLKRCGGAYFVRQYLYLEPIIKNKRTRNNGGSHYDEFEKVARKLKIHYEKKSAQIINWYYSTSLIESDKAKEKE